MLSVFERRKNRERREKRQMRKKRGEGEERIRKVPIRVVRDGGRSEEGRRKSRSQPKTVRTICWEWGDSLASLISFPVAGVSHEE